MLVTTTLALAGALTVVDRCRWNKPGADRYTGDVVAAVDHYQDIPPAIRDRLKSRLARHDYEDRVTITRDEITGKKAYEPGITGMHFGSDRLCGQVSRTRWRPDRRIEGLVYCEDGYCLLVPAVCGNLSRIQPARHDEPLDIEPGAGPTAAPPVREAPEGGGATGPADDHFAALPPTGAGLPDTVDTPASPPPPFFYHPWVPGPYIGTGPFVPPFVDVPPVVPVVPGVPEPATWWQLVSGIAVLAAARTWRAKARGVDQPAA